MALGVRYGRYRATRHFRALLGFRDFCLQENEYCPETLKVSANRAFTAWQPKRADLLVSITLTNAAAVVAGLAIIGSPLLISRKGLLPRLAVTLGLSVLAAVLIHAIA